MRILALDLESTGLATDKDRIIEIGAVVYQVETKTPVQLISTFINPGDEFLPLSPEIEKLTGLTSHLIGTEGVGFITGIAQVSAAAVHHEVKYLCAHNAHGFDRPLLAAELARHNIVNSVLMSLPVIDTKWDLPFKEEPRSRHLNHLAMDHGFINPFPHRALFDSLTMLRIMSHYDFAEIEKLSKEPWIMVRAQVGYDTREKAKAKKYQWDGARSIWVKRIRAADLEKEKVGSDFPVLLI